MKYSNDKINMINVIINRGQENNSAAIIADQTVD